MTINYYLEDPKATKLTAINLFVRDRGITIKLNTGIKVNPTKWNPNSSSSPVKRSVMEAQQLNLYLEQIKGKVMELVVSGVTDKVELKTKLQDHLQGRRLQVKDSVQDDLTRFISERESSKVVTLNTIKKYKTLLQHIKDYQESRGVLSYEGINYSFYNEFSSYLRNDKRQAKNTIAKYLKAFKAFINWAKTTNIPMAEKATTAFKLETEKVEVIALTREELDSIYHLQLAFGGPLDKARDLFCFQCYTGQRFSDIINLQHEDLQDGVWILHQIKVKDTIARSIPLPSQALSILDKYKSHPLPLPRLSNQKANEYLKEVARKAGILSKQKIVKYRGAERSTTTYEKWQLISTHAARRTFISVALSKGIRPETVMAVSGHTDYKSMRPYIMVNTEMLKAELHELWS